MWNSVMCDSKIFSFDMWLLVELKHWDSILSMRVSLSVGLRGGKKRTFEFFL